MRYMSRPISTTRTYGRRTSYWKTFTGLMNSRPKIRSIRRGCGTAARSSAAASRVRSCCSTTLSAASPRGSRLSSMITIEYSAAVSSPKHKRLCYTSNMQAVFLDRDGTLIVDPPDLRVDSISKIHLFPDVFKAMKRLSELDYAVFIVTNQAGIAEG